MTGNVAPGTQETRASGATGNLRPWNGAPPPGRQETHVTGTTGNTSGRQETRASGTTGNAGPRDDRKRLRRDPPAPGTRENAHGKAPRQYSFEIRLRRNSLALPERSMGLQSAPRALHELPERFHVLPERSMNFQSIPRRSTALHESHSAPWASRALHERFKSFQSAP